MERQSIVLTASIDFGDATYKASYFIERDMICANIGGRVIVDRVGSRPAEEKVKSLLRGFALKERTRLALLQAWSAERAAQREINQG